MNKFKEIPLVQGSDEWLKYRTGKIMGTDASIILQVNPWSKPIDLWKEKLGLTPPKAENKAMARGKALEAEARNLANLAYDQDFKDCVIESIERPYQAGSLDGISSDGTIILEIKCCGLKNHNAICEGNIPDYYITQVQHLLSVSGADYCIFMAYNPDAEEKIKYINIAPDKDYIDKMNKKEYEFWKKLITLEEP